MFHLQRDTHIANLTNLPDCEIISFYANKSELAVGTFCKLQI